MSHYLSTVVPELPTLTITPEPTRSPTLNTLSPTAQAPNTPTASLAPTVSITPTLISTSTPVLTPSASITSTATNTLTAIPYTFTSTSTATATATSTATATATATLTSTITNTQTPTATSLPPQITSISDLAVLPNQTISINGNNFDSNSVGKINDIDCTTTTFVSSSQLNCLLPASLIAIGEYSVSVQNVDLQSATLGTPLYMITSPTLWLKADDITGVANGDPVSSWSDSGVNGHIAAQTDSSKQPILVSSGIKGLPAVRFDDGDGTDDSLRITGDADFDTNTVTVLAVLQDTSGSDNSAKVIVRPYYGGAWSSPYNSYALATNNQLFSKVTSGSVESVDLTVPKDVPIMLSARYDGTTIDGYIGRSNIFKYTVSTPGNIDYSGAANVDLAIAANAFYQDQGGNFSGDIAEILLYGSALSDADIRVIQNYLAAKYDL